MERASDEEEQAQFVGADEVCGGPFAGLLAETLEKVTGKMVFVGAMGEDAGAAHDAAHVAFACSHKDQPGSSQKNAYATLAHSFALAMAKELKCDNNGGLEDKPSLVPAS